MEKTPPQKHKIKNFWINGSFFQNKFSPERRRGGCKGRYRPAPPGQVSMMTIHAIPYDDHSHEEP